MKRILLTWGFMALTVLVFSQTHFTATPLSGCSPLEVSFVNGHPSNGYAPVMGQTTGFVYSWDFDNGQTSTSENPTPVTYSGSLDRDILFSCTIDTVGYILTQIDVTAANATDPLWGAIDVFVVITDAGGTEVLHTSYIDDTNPPVSFTSLNVPLTNPPYFVRVWDYDSSDDNDNCVDDSEDTPGTATILTLPANTSANFGLTSQTYTNVGLTFTAYFNKPVTFVNDTAHIDILPSPASPTMNVTSGTFCANEVLPVLEASGTGTVNWYSDSTLQNWLATGDTMAVSSLTPGQHYFYVTVSDATCESMPAQVSIEILDPVEADVQVQTVSCPGMTDGSASVTVTQGVAPYEYIWFNGDSANSVSGLAPGEYDLTIIDGNFCLNVFSIIVGVPDTLHAKATITDASCDGLTGGSVLMEGVGGTPPYEFNWEENGSSAQLDQLAHGVYAVEVLDSRGCSLDTTVYIGVGDGCLDLSNIITPNGDGQNDVWVIQATDRYPGIVVMAFDRTGTLVFESNGYAEPWDATFNGKLLPVGSYFYIIDLGDGTEQLTGSIDIVY